MRGRWSWGASFIVLQGIVWIIVGPLTRPLLLWARRTRLMSHGCRDGVRRWSPKDCARVRHRRSMGCGARRRSHGGGGACLPGPDSPFPRPRDCGWRWGLASCSLVSGSGLLEQRHGSTCTARRSTMVTRTCMQHEGSDHSHSHVHSSNSHFRHRHLTTLVGAFHGLAGTAPLVALLPVTMISDIWAAFGYPRRLVSAPRCPWAFTERSPPPRPNGRPYPLPLHTDWLWQRPSPV